MDRAGWLALVIVLSACRIQPSRDPICIAHCERANDTCLLRATTAMAIQECEGRTHACVSYCHSY